MVKKRIFVSCGRATEAEKNLGREIVSLIRAHGMDGFFAEAVPSGLNSFTFKELQACDAFLAVLHNRAKRGHGASGSVWIQQEIAIIAYRSFVEGHRIPMRVYEEEGTFREGMLKRLVLSPVVFRRQEEVLADVPAWLKGPDFKEHTGLGRRESLFQQRVNRLQEKEWLLLGLLAAHSSKPGDAVDPRVLEEEFVRTVSSQRESEAKTLFIQAWKHLWRYSLVERVTDPSAKGERLAISKKSWDLVYERLHNKRDSN